MQTQEQNEGKPVALVHMYGLHPHSRKLDTRTKRVLRAAEILWNKKQISGVVVTGGHLFHGQPRLGTMMAKELMSRNPSLVTYQYYGLRDGAKSTAGEVKLFQEFTSKMHLSNLVDIGSEAHIPDIHDELKRAFGRDIPVFSAEEVMARSGQPHYQPYVTAVRESKDEKAFQQYEAMVIRIKQLPKGRQLLEMVSAFPWKGQINTFISRNILKK